MIDRTVPVLAKVFPGLKVQRLGAVPIPPAALDTSLGCYDVHFLLQHLPLPSTDVWLWVVGVPLGYFWQPNLLGAAADRRAVVSGAALPEEASLVTEICHETGHLLGLRHCQEACCMRSSRSAAQVQTKPAYLCASCRQIWLAKQEFLQKERVR